MRTREGGRKRGIFADDPYSDHIRKMDTGKLFLLHLDFGDKCHRKKLNLTVSLSLNYQLAFIYSNFDYQAN